MNKSRLSPILVIMILFVPTLNYTFSSVEFTNKSYEEIMNPFTSNSRDLTGTRIIIDNNWSATASAYDWCSGNGSFNNPYIIENVIINGLGRESCVLIANSSVHFVIRNSKFINTTYSFSNYYFSGGIILRNVSNGQLINNNCSFNENGIDIEGYNNSVINNHIANNTIGIATWGESSPGTFTSISENNIAQNSIGILGSSTIYGANGAQISLNNINNNEDYGIFLGTAYNFSITKNVINNNFGKGIYLSSCWHNDISKNEITNNTDEGIYLEGFYDAFGEPQPVRNYNRVSENNVNNNSYGIMLRATDCNQIINNIVNYNHDGGISLDNCDLNNVFNNTVNNNDIGTNLSNCISNDVVANTINDNERYGIHLHYTDFTSVLNNNISNSYIGISVSNSKRNDIVANEINNNHYGIYFTDSRLNAVINNTLLHNGKCFVEEGNYDDNTFEDNVCPEGEGLNVGLIITITLLSTSMISLVIMFWFVKKRSVRE